MNAQFRFRDLMWLIVVAALAIGWVVDRQIQANRRAAIERQMNRFYWQADKLTRWIENADGVKSVDVNVDTINISREDGRSETFSRTP